MSGGNWGLVGLGGSKHGLQSLTFFFFFFFFKLVERYTPCKPRAHVTNVLQSARIDTALEVIDLPRCLVQPTLLLCNTEDLIEVSHT